MRTAEERARDHDAVHDVGGFERDRIAALLRECEAEVRADERRRVLTEVREMARGLSERWRVEEWIRSKA